jgi:hypothetical protein
MQEDLGTFFDSVMKYFVAQQHSKGNPYLDAIAELRNRLQASFKLPLSVCPSALGSHWKDFPEIRYFRIFRKSVETVQVSLISGKKNGYFRWRLQYFAEFFLEWEIFQKKFVEKFKTHFMFSEVFFIKSCPLWNNMKNMVERIGHRRQYSMLHACWGN